MKVLPAPESCVFFVLLQAVSDSSALATARMAFVLCLTFENLLGRAVCGYGKSLQPLTELEVVSALRRSLATGRESSRVLDSRGACMSGELKGRKIAILATDGFEQVELTDPKKNVENAGATAEVLSVKDGSIKGWRFTDWGESVRVDKQLSKANADDYDALILPGGQINPDKLRMETSAVEFV